MRHVLIFGFELLSDLFMGMADMLRRKMKSTTYQLDGAKLALTLKRNK